MTCLDLISEEMTKPKRIFSSYQEADESRAPPGTLVAQIRNRRAEVRLLAKAKYGTQAFYQHSFRQFGSAFAGQFIGSHKLLPKRVAAPEVLKTNGAAVPESHQAEASSGIVGRDTNPNPHVVETTRNEISPKTCLTSDVSLPDEGSLVFTVQLEARAEIPEFVIGFNEDGTTLSAGPFKSGQHFFLDRDVAAALLAHKLAKQIGYGGS